MAELADLLTERLRSEDALMPTDKSTGKPIEFPGQVVQVRESRRKVPEAAKAR
ncbi:MAG: hypothetical protein ACYC6Y_01475 [Thermoguttaceae bacterium]